MNKLLFKNVSKKLIWFTCLLKVDTLWAKIKLEINRARNDKTFPAYQRKIRIIKIVCSNLNNYCESIDIRVI